MIIYNINNREKELSGNKYLLVCQGEELEIFQYVRIISDSDVAYNLHLMDFKHKVQDDEVMYYYTIGDRVSLHEMADAKGLRKRNFLSVISSIAHALSEAEKYGLAQECFIIDSNFIYVGEVDTLLAYVPLEINVDPKEEFRRLMGFVANKLIDGQEDFKNINTIIKKDFSFKDICEYFDDSEKNTEDDDKEDNALSDKIERIHFNEFVWGEGQSTGDDIDPKNSDNVTQRDETKPKKEGFFSALFGRKESSTKPSKTPKEPKTTVIKNEKDKNEPSGKPFSLFDEDDVTVIDDVDGVTMMDEAAYLLCNAPLDESEKEKVAIEETPFFIARRFPGGVSASGLFIARKYISSRHAEIIREENNYYIVDVGKDGKGSKGGTFVNGTMLAPNVRTLLNDGDLVKFYKLEYTFHVE